MGYRDWAERHIQAAEQRQLTGPLYVRKPLRTEQHILHALLTVFTLGLWAPVWLIRGISGNRVPVGSVN